MITLAMTPLQAALFGWVWGFICGAALIIICWRFGK